MKRTEYALLARGVYAATATNLVKQGWTLGRLKQQDKASLQRLGLSADAVDALLGEGRPPIPTAVMQQLLFANRFQCCVCRDPQQPVIVHHIVPWSVSRSHAPTNLAVLCLNHHERAHTTSSLARNLDEATLRAHKERWEALCAEFDRNAILEASRLDHAAWVYFNHLRLFEIAHELGIELRAIAGFAGALQEGLIGGDGVIAPVEPSHSYMYEQGVGMRLYPYVRGVLAKVVSMITVLNISDLLDRGQLSSLIAEGDFVFVQGAHTFHALGSRNEGIGQATEGTRRANGVRVRFVFDRWEATSCSAWACWLGGRQAVGSLVQVKSITRTGDECVIEGTVLGISNGHGSLKSRDYAPRLGRHHYALSSPEEVWDGDNDELDEWESESAE